MCIFFILFVQDRSLSMVPNRTPMNLLSRQTRQTINEQACPTIYPTISGDDIKNYVCVCVFACMCLCVCIHVSKARIWRPAAGKCRPKIPTCLSS